MIIFKIPAVLNINHSNQEKIDLIVFIRLFHYPEDHGGVKPKELSPFVGPKSKISEKLEQN